VKHLRICGESGEVRGETVESWKERLPEIVQRYEKENVWNMDETGVFWHALPDRGFGQKSRSCKGGKKGKQRITVAFFVSASGQKEKPVVIWRSKNPRCLQRFNKSCLPVSSYSQNKSMDDWGYTRGYFDQIESPLVQLKSLSFALYG